jgi:hypothetical protein
LRDPGNSTIPSRAASLGESPYAPDASASAPSMAKFPMTLMLLSGVPPSSNCRRLGSSTANTRANSAR